MDNKITNDEIIKKINKKTDDFVLDRIKEIVETGSDPNGIIGQFKDMIKEKEQVEATAITEYVPSDYDYIKDHLIDSLVEASWMLTEVASDESDVKNLIKYEVEDGTYSVSARNFKVPHWFYRINASIYLGFRTKSIDFGIGEYKPDSHEAGFIARHKYTAIITFNHDNELVSLQSNTDTDDGFMDWAGNIYNKEITEFLKEVYYIIEKHRNKGDLKCCMTATNKDMSGIII